MVLALITAAVTTVGVRSALPAPATANHGLTALGLVVLIVGLVALTPLPRLSSASLTALARALIPPVVVAAVMCVAVFLLANLAGQQAGLRGVAEIAFYWLTLVVAVSSPAIALCRLDPSHLHIPGNARAAVGLAVVVAGHSIGGIAGMLFAATPGTNALAVVQLVLAALTLVALTDLRRRRLA